MLEGGEERCFKVSPQTKVGEMLNRYFSSMNKEEEIQYYALFFNGQLQDPDVALGDARFGEPVHLLVKESPLLKRSIAVTVVNVLTGEKEQAVLGFGGQSDLVPCIEVEMKEKDEG